MRLSMAHPVEVRVSTIIKVLVVLFMVLTFILYNLVRVGKDHSKLQLVTDTALKAKGQQFTLKGKPLRIISGAMHYFRIVPEYWKDRLLKAKAMGLNTIETYVAWNVHEPIRGKFNFKGQVDLSKFILLAQEVGLHVIVRPGPYICSEWDFGGLPSWLLHDPDMEIRSVYPGFMKAVEDYFDKLMPILEPLQISKGGPVIAVQVENEYGSYGDSMDYMSALKKAMYSRGIKELLFTSDNAEGITKNLLPGILRTVNFQNKVDYHLDTLRSVQPDKPLMVMEFWSGWFDHFGENHHVVNPEKTAKTTQEILERGASVNFYMFHGGTNFGFMNGANDFGEYKSDVTSYDYDSPLSEAGDITKKYELLRNVIKKYNPSPDIPLPSPIPKTSYGSVKLTHVMPLKQMMTHLMSVEKKHVVPMEMLPINNQGGQSYGYTIYHVYIPTKGGKLVIHEARDYGVVLVNKKPVATLEMNKDKHEIEIKPSKNAIRVDIIIENMGRVNYHSSMNKQRKGILGKVFLGDKELAGWEIYPLSFPNFYLDALDQNGAWLTKVPPDYTGPSLYRGTLVIKGNAKDTFLSLQGWTKCTCFINGHNLGRYWNIGPQRTLYVPAPWLKKGHNSVTIFELHSPSATHTVEFVDKPELGPVEENDI